MSLDEYLRKRDFSRTPEPHGETHVERKPSNDEKIYVIQKHAASHLHYDLRLEKDGVLKSWAIPKEPPTVKNVKRLAIQTEDHPIEYANFEGVIPEGEYGAGTVEIWDRGTFNVEEWTDEKIIVYIRGEKLKGRYCLIKFKGRENSWLFFKA
ncbi:MAG: DNA polymerase ligase N-terminal domain-containing protein [Candidatus Bathyarchaeia archaeon]|nr:3'-phosphoesterase [Candidatus Bathyarchaeota archaeon]